MYDTENLPLVDHLQAALTAKEFLRRDRDYLIAGGEAVMIDKVSGRLHHGRRYGDGVHAAIEAKEGLTVRVEREPLTIVRVKDYLRQYRRLAGMTGTAMPEAETY